MIVLSDIRPGLPVIIHTPENLILHGRHCTVRTVTDYGAVVETGVGSGEFRALPEELNHPNPVERPPRSLPNPRDMGFTGATCTTCGSSKMIRDGKCEKCLECGSTAGGCS